MALVKYSGAAVALAAGVGLSVGAAVGLLLAIFGMNFKVPRVRFTLFVVGFFVAFQTD